MRDTQTNGMRNILHFIHVRLEITAASLLGVPGTFEVTQLDINFFRVKSIRVATPASVEREHAHARILYTCIIVAVSFIISSH